MEETNKATGMDCNLMQPPEDRDAGPKHKRTDKDGNEKKKQGKKGEAKMAWYCQVPGCAHRTENRTFAMQSTHDTHILKCHKDTGLRYVIGHYCRVEGTYTSHNANVFLEHRTPHILHTFHAYSCL